MLKTFVFFITLLPVSCFAQFKISGRILNQADTKPVSNASVFLSNATIGSKTTDNGTFILQQVKSGNYELIVSVLGFQSFSQVIVVNNTNIALPDIKLSPKTIGLQEVTVKFDRTRERNLNWFKDQFLGMSDLSKECKLLNPEILDLEYDDAKGELIASSDDFVEIENKALGYRISYLLTNFKLNNKDPNNEEVHYEGYALFHELSGTAEQKKTWEENRQRIYENSSLNFLRCALDDKLEENGFRTLQIANYPNPKRPSDDLIAAKIYFYKNKKNSNRHNRDSLSYWIKKSELPRTLQRRMQFPLTKQDIIKSTGQPGIYSLECDNDGLYVMYNRNHHFHAGNRFDRLGPNNNETTVVNFITPYALFDSNGAMINVNSLAYYGVWARNRIAEALPLNYEPAKTSTPADSSVVKNVVAALNKFSTDHPVEKVYLQFNKPFYTIGDTIYFKAYVTLGEEHKLTNLSGVLHVDLLNPADSVVRSINLQLNHGLAWGDFVVPDSLSGGIYQIGAYTQWMRNQEENKLFYRLVPVVAVKSDSTLQSILPNRSETDTMADIQFFPEGGSLVTGIRSKVAFKAIGSNGLGIDIKGIIVDNDNKEMASFSSGHLGMGYFYLTPKEGKTFKAHVFYLNGKDRIIDLPVPDAKSIILSVNNDLPDKIQIKIESDRIYYRENRNRDYMIIIYSGGFTATYICKLTSQSVTLTVSKSDLHIGVARVALFSPSGEPLSERLSFIQNADQLSLSVNADKQIYTKREKVKINLNMTAPAGGLVRGNFSVTVINQTLIPVNESTETSILANLLLTSELKGFVEKPNYYFVTPGDQAKTDLDILMLTQGYRGFEWQQILNHTASPNTWQPERSLELSGTLMTTSGQRIPNGKILLVATKENIIRDTTADLHGNFKFRDLYFADGTLMMLRTGKENNSESVKIQINTVNPPRIAKIANENAISEISPQTKLLMQRNYIKRLRKEDGNVMLKQVTIKGYKPPRHVQLTHSGNLNGPGHADYVIMGDQLDGCVNLKDCLNGKIPGAKFIDGKLYSIRTGRRLNGSNGPPMALIIDGTILDLKDQPLDQINPNDISSIEILTSAAYLTIYGSDAPGGALVITTKRGDENFGKSRINKASPGLVIYLFQGFYKARSFYSPKYTATNTDGPNDQSSAIYWNPNIVTDKYGKASFDYFNNDTKGTYRIIIEGIDDNGNLGRAVYRYEVK